jgi:TatD DNase family protein
MLEVPAEDILAAAKAAAVDRMITIGTGHDDHPLVMQLVDAYQPVVFGALGFHPHDASTYNDEGEAFLQQHLSHPRIVALGEIGLDYYYEHSDRDVQKRVFRRQLELAVQFDLPVEIHTRDAEEDTIAILSEFKGKVRGIIHCFTGTQWLADQSLALGFNISISGVVTFKNAEALRDVVRSLPLDRLHVETDAPFLTPVPFRGKKNTPAMIVHTARTVAELQGVSLEQLSQATRQNALKMFPKLEWSS